MKGRRYPSLVLVLCLVAGMLTSSDSTAKAQERGRRFAGDTGIVTLGPNQMLRVTAAGDGRALDNLLTIRLSRIEYAQEGCGGGACRLSVAFRETIAPMTLGPGEAVSTNIRPMPEVAGVRVLVVADGSVKPIAMIVNTVTGAVEKNQDIEVENDESHW